VLIGTPPKSNNKDLASGMSGERHSLNASLEQKNLTSPIGLLGESKNNTEPKNPLV